MSRFEREMRAIGSMDHVNLVRAYDAGETEDGRFLYLAMELVDGVDVGKVVKSRRTIAIADACEIVRQAAVGLEYVHQQGQIHRDIKPSNLMINRDGTVKILDLGLALLHEPQRGATSTGMIMGTPDYMSPEQATDSHRVDARADIYSLGCTLYELLSGQPPFANHATSAIEKVLAHKETSVTSLSELKSEIPSPLVELVQRMLAKSPEDRPASAQQIADELAPFTGGTDLSRLASEQTQAVEETVSRIEQTTSLAKLPLDLSRSPTRSTATARQSVSNRVLYLGTAAVVVMALLALAAVFVFRTHYGTVEIQLAAGSDAEDIQVVAKRGGKTIEIADKTNGWMIDIKEGQYTFELKGQGAADKFRLEQDTLVVQRRKKEILRIIVTPSGAETARLSKQDARLVAPVPTTSPLSRFATLQNPPALEGVKSWSIESTTLEDPRQRYDRLALRADGRQIAHLSNGFRGVSPWLMIREVPSARVQQMLSFEGDYIGTFEWAPTGTVLAVGTARGIAFVDTETGRRLSTIPTTPGIVRWSRDGSMLADVGQNSAIWDVESGKQLLKFPGFGAHSSDVAWSPDGSQLAIACNQAKKFQILDRATGKSELFLAPFESLRLDWSPEGGRLAIAACSFESKDVAIWDIQEKREVARVPGQEQAVQDASWAPDGSLVMAGVWVAKRFQNVGSPEQKVSRYNARGGDGVRISNISANSKYLATASANAIAVHQFETGEEVLRLSNAVAYHRVVAASADGRFVAVAFDDRGSAIRFWDLNSPSLVFDTVQISRDSAALLRWSRRSSNLAIVVDGSLSVAIGDKPRDRRVFANADQGILSASFSSNEELLATHSASGKGQLWRVSAAGLATNLEGNVSSSLAWSPDDAELAGIADGKLTIWNSESRKSVATFAADISRLESSVVVIDWSADGKHIAVADTEQVHLFARQSLELLHKIIPGDGDITEMEITNDSMSLSLVRVHPKKRQTSVEKWDLMTGKQSSSMVLDGSGRLAGSRIWSSAWNVQLRDLTSGDIVATLVGHRPDNAAVISPSGHYRTGSEADPNPELVYVVSREDGTRQALTPGDFSTSFAWTNRPETVMIASQIDVGGTGDKP